MSKRWINTEVIFDMNTGKQESCKGYWYEGEVAECGRKFEWRGGTTKTHPSGAYTIMDEKYTDAGWWSGWNRAGYRVRSYSPTGELLSEKYYGQTKDFVGGTSGYLNSANERVTSIHAGFGETYGWESPEELEVEEKEEDKTEEYRQELRKQTSKAQQSVTDVAAIEGEKTRRQLAQVASASTSQMKNALLAQGYTAEEAEAMVAKGGEQMGRQISDVSLSEASAKERAKMDIAQLDISNIKDAEGLSAKLKEISNSMILGKKNIAAQLDIGRWNANATASAGQAGKEGSQWGALGNVAASLPWDKIGAWALKMLPAIFREGGQIPNKPVMDALKKAYKNNG